MADLNVFALFFVVAGSVFCLSALRLMWKHQLFSRLPIIIVCLILITGGVLAVAVALDLHGYQPVKADRPVAVIYVQALPGNRLRARIKDAAGDEYSTEATGTHWQVSARIFRWNNRVLPINIPTLIRLEYLRGLSISPGLAGGVDVAEKVLHQKYVNFDSWKILKSLPGLRRVISMQETITVKVPVRDATVFALNKGRFGLILDETSGSSAHPGARMENIWIN